MPFYKVEVLVKNDDGKIFTYIWAGQAASEKDAKQKVKIDVAKAEFFNGKNATVIEVVSISVT